MLVFLISKRKLLFRYVTFPFMLVLLMGMVNPEGDEQDYDDTYNEIVGEYNQFNAAAPVTFNNFKNSLLIDVNIVRAHANSRIAWANSNVALTRSNFSRAHLLYHRIRAISASFQSYTQHIRARSIPGRVNLDPDEQLLMEAVHHSERIEKNARDVYTSAGRSLRTAAHISPDNINLPTGMHRYDIPAGIVPIQNEEHEINQNIIQLQNLVPNVGLNDVQGIQNIIQLHNDSLEKVQLITNSANFIAQFTRNSFDDVLVLGQLMRDIRQEFNNIQNLIPQGAEFELPIDNFNYPVLPGHLLNRITWH